MVEEFGKGQGRSCEDNIFFEVVTIGEELLSGYVVDTNAAMIAEKFLNLGYQVRRMTSVGDSGIDIGAVLQETASRSRLVIITGGLGPTGDDRTAEAAARTFGRVLRLHEPTLQRIRERLDRMGLPLTANRERQARIPAGAEVLDNPEGTAPGFALDVSGSLLIFLPGVPGELQALLEQRVLPLVENRLPLQRVVLTHTLKIFGLAEATIDDMIRGALEDIPGLSLASLPRRPINRLRLTACGGSRQEVMETLEKADKRLRGRIGNWVMATNDEEVEEIVEDLLRQRGSTMAVAESCTGGLIFHRLTEVPGSSDVVDRGLVTYSPRAKMDLLGVSGTLLDDPGPVSAEVAEAMAAGIRERSGTSLGLSTTGVAGPSGGTAETPVGTVFFGLADHRHVWSRRFQFRGGRSDVKDQAAMVALDWLRRFLLGEDPAAYRLPWI
jgi:nicotinamide-nucleotide amidase